MRKGTRGGWLGSGMIMAGLIAMFAAAGGIGAGSGCSGGGVGGGKENAAGVGNEGGGAGSDGGAAGNEGGGPANEGQDLATIVDVELPACVDASVNGVIHFDREFTGELDLELFYRSKEDQQPGSGGAAKELIDTGRRATVRFDGSSTGSFNFGHFKPDDDARCFEVNEASGKASFEWASWKRRKSNGACIPVCSATTTTTTSDTTTTRSTTSTTTVPSTTSTSTSTTTTPTTTKITSTTTSTPTSTTTTVPTTTQTSSSSTTTVPTTTQTTSTSTTTIPVTTTTATTSTGTTTGATTGTTTTSTTTVPTTTTRVADPTFDPRPGVYYVCGALAVFLFDDTAGADIYYTLDGSTPSSSSRIAVVNASYGNRYIDVLFEGPGTTTTVKAIAIKDGISSNVVQATYTLYQEPDPAANCW